MDLALRLLLLLRFVLVAMCLVHLAVAQMQGGKIDKMLEELLTCVESYISTETKWQEWVYESRDAEVISCLRVMRKGWVHVGEKPETDNHCAGRLRFTPILCRRAIFSIN